MQGTAQKVFGIVFLVVIGLVGVFVWRAVLLWLPLMALLIANLFMEVSRAQHEITTFDLGISSFPFTQLLLAIAA